MVDKKSILNQPTSDLSVDRYRQNQIIENRRQDRWFSRYDDLEQLLFRGFLTCSASINGIPIVFKSVNSIEFDKIKFYLGLSDDVIKNQLYFIAHSIFLLNDVNFLIGRDRNIPYILKGFRQLPSSILGRIAEYLTILNNKSMSSGSLVEAYCYEDISRQNWMSLKGHVLDDPKITGIDGTQNMGLNTYQKMWVCLNNMEDLKIAREIDWDYAKFVGSCFNPKGVRSIENHDKARRAREVEEREMIRKGGVREDDTIKVQANTVEELMDQLEHSLKGEKDWHDEVVEKHEQKLIEEHEKQKEEYLNIMENLPMDVKFGMSSLDEEKKVFSLDEIQQSLEKRRKGIIDSPSMRRLAALSQELGPSDSPDPSIKSDIIEGVEVSTPDIRRK